MNGVSYLTSVTLLAIGFVTLSQPSTTAMQTSDRHQEHFAPTTIAAQWTPPPTGLPRRLSGGGTR